jgi:hypothetical protein
LELALFHFVEVKKFTERSSDELLRGFVVDESSGRKGEGIPGTLEDAFGGIIEEEE